MRELTRREILATLSVSAAGLGALAATGEAAAAELQPHMRAALVALRTAQKELRDASPDKGGHRNVALELVEITITQVEKGIEYDNKT